MMNKETNPLGCLTITHTEKRVKKIEGTKKKKKAICVCVWIMNMTPMNMLIISGIHRDRAHTPEYYSNHHTETATSIIYLERENRKEDGGKKEKARSV